jgi:hypothetical protein
MTFTGTVFPEINANVSVFVPSGGRVLFHGMELVHGLHYILTRV